jgi:hypothetical protein
VPLPFLRRLVRQSRFSGSMAAAGITKGRHADDSQGDGKAGMQNSGGTGCSLQLRIISGEGLDGLPTAPGQDRIKRALMLPGQKPEFFGQGKGQQEIRGGDLFLKLTLKPSLAFIMLAMRAAAMAAGMRHKDLAFAVLALGQHHRTLRGPAELHDGQRLALAR